MKPKCYKKGFSTNVIDFKNVVYNVYNSHRPVLIPDRILQSNKYYGSFI